MATTISTLAQTLRERFNTQWATFSPTYPHFFPGQPWIRAISTIPRWVRLAINFGLAEQVGFTNAGARKRTPGVAQVQIFVPAGLGDGLAQELADQVASVWELSKISGVLFRATSVQRVGTDGAWLQFNADTPFQADWIVGD